MRALDRQRWMDLVLGVVLGTIALPIVGVVALVVRWRLGRPVLFRQERAGRDGQPFEVIKIRTMTADLGPDGALLPDKDRLTPLGRRLRATSLDELPELWNILRGEMSLVGPRPLPVRYLDRYTTEQARRHDVRPGITGWAQVNGRNTTSWKDRLALDVWYVEHRSMRLDLRILARTIAAVVTRRGISAPGQATMHEFDPEADPS